MGPLFPRLHVNDANKGGGPRAPPRNKMALTSLLPASSSSQGGGHQRSMFSSFSTPSQAPAHSTGNVDSCCSNGMNLNALKTGFERKYGKNGTQRTVDASGDLQSVAECSSFHPHDFSKAKDSRGKKMEDEGDFSIPTFIKPGTAPHSDKISRLIEKERMRPFHSHRPQKSLYLTGNSSILVPSSHGKHLEHSHIFDLKSRQREKINGKQKAKGTLSLNECTEKSVSHLAIGEKATEPSNYVKSSSNQECAGDKLKELENAQHGSASLCKEFSSPPDRLRCLIDVEAMKQEDTSKARSGSCSKLSNDNSYRNPIVAENPNAEGEDKAPGSLEKGDGDKNDEVSETSMVESICGLDISPDDVVGVIGPDHFWKARRAIVNQQRIFSIQVFELHKLIKVQKLIAASPHLLLEDSSSSHLLPADSSCLSRSSSKNLSAEYWRKSPPQVDKQEDGSAQANGDSECPTENTAVPPLRPREDGLLNKGPTGQLSRNGSYSGNPPSMPVPSDNKPIPWCFPLPGSQWLIPVTSPPEEGLSYNPYTGPYPPPVAFMSPVYGGCSPLSVPLVAGDFMSAAFGVTGHLQQQNIALLPSASQVAPTYFPTHYGSPVVNLGISSSSVKQGSAASSPCEGARGEGRDALPLFHMAPTPDNSGHHSQARDSDDQSRVIKVVPHNRRSAMAAAARIFRSIQKERGESMTGCK